MNDFRFYFGIGWDHIINIEALDHLLFIAALSAIYMLKDWKQVLILVTAFTIGHTITLVLSAKEWVSINKSLVEFLIPCTIAVTAVANLAQKRFTPKAIRINYALALFFGLIHGLAFATTLRMLLATDQSFALAMVSFSLGLESGQVIVVLLILLLAQAVVGLARLDRRRWVAVVSIIVFAIAVDMAIHRWPAKPETAARRDAWLQKERPSLTIDFIVAASDTAPMERQWRRSVQPQKIDGTRKTLYANT